MACFLTPPLFDAPAREEPVRVSDAQGWSSQCQNVKYYKWRLNPVNRKAYDTSESFPSKVACESDFRKKTLICVVSLRVAFMTYTIRYDREFNVDSKAEYTA